MIMLGDGLEGSGAVLQEKATSWGDKNIFQGETRALFGLISYPVQDDQSHNEMLWPPALFTQSPACARAGTCQGCGRSLCILQQALGKGSVNHT